MDYKQLSTVCELMGGRCGYGRFTDTHFISVEIGNITISENSKSESAVITAVIKKLREDYPIQYTNAFNQLNIK